MKSSSDKVLGLIKDEDKGSMNRFEDERHKRRDKRKRSNNDSDGVEFQLNTRSGRRCSNSPSRAAALRMEPTSSDSSGDDEKSPPIVASTALEASTRARLLLSADQSNSGMSPESVPPPIFSSSNIPTIDQTTGSLTSSSWPESIASSSLSQYEDRGEDSDVVSPSWRTSSDVADHGNNERSFEKSFDGPDGQTVSTINQSLWDEQEPQSWFLRVTTSNPGTTECVGPVSRNEAQQDTQAFNKFDGNNAPIHGSLAQEQNNAAQPGLFQTTGIHNAHISQFFNNAALEQQQLDLLVNLQSPGLSNANHQNSVLLNHRHGGISSALSTQAGNFDSLLILMQQLQANQVNNAAAVFSNLSLISNEIQVPFQRMITCLPGFQASLPQISWQNGTLSGSIPPLQIAGSNRDAGRNENDVSSTEIARLSNAVSVGASLIRNESPSVRAYEGRPQGNPNHLESLLPTPSFMLGLVGTPELPPQPPREQRSKVLYMDRDARRLSKFQCLVRKSIELFEATVEDVRCGARGRKNPIVLGQVGIRCRFCKHLPPNLRTRGTVYYPTKFNGVYQTAVNMATIHLCEHCKEIPEDIRKELIARKASKSLAGGGKEYWGDGVRMLACSETADGLKFEDS